MPAPAPEAVPLIRFSAFDQAMLTQKCAQGDGKSNLQNRVAELETALLTISQKLETPKTIKSHDDAVNALEQLRSGILPSTPIASPVSTPEILLKHAPVLSLFDNSILSRRPDESSGVNSNGIGPPQLETKSDSNPKLDHIRRALLSLFPSEERTESILNASYTWWAGWQDMFPRIFGLGPNSNVVQFVADSKNSGSVQKIAKVLLCLLVILEERSVSLNTNDDMANAAGQTKQALSMIDEMVIADDELAGTIDGLECMILRAKHETDNGRIRKAWLTFRRAIGFAQLLGLHKRIGSSESNTNEPVRKESIWKSLYASDRLLSLILGLPYGPAEIHSSVDRDSESSAKGIQRQDIGELYLFRLANIVGHIIDRNQQLPSNNMLPLTFKIEAEMMELSASMTSSWWESGLKLCDKEKQMWSQLLPQFWHHQARTLLHLPFMLKATTDRRYEYNKIATLESAREMIARYRIIRPVQGFGSLVCRMIDFQVFTAAMILVLNLLDHYRKSNIVDHSEAEHDQDLILVTTNILQRASVETDSSVATQAARALEIFSKIQAMACPLRDPGHDCATKVVIPYFGTVVIGPGTSFKDQSQVQRPEAMAYPQQLPTPSERSLDGSTPKFMASEDSATTPTGPFDLQYGVDTGGMGISGDVFADVNFDLDQDWTWFWNNIDVPSMDIQGMGT